jgi:hypothetical protein
MYLHSTHPLIFQIKSTVLYCVTGYLITSDHQLYNVTCYAAEDAVQIVNSFIIIPIPT